MSASDTAVSVVAPAVEVFNAAEWLVTRHAVATPDAPADLVIAGTGSHEPVLREIAADSPRVRFLGRLAPERLAPLYRRAARRDHGR